MRKIVPPSVVQLWDRECFICGRTEHLHRHHCFEGAYRGMAEKYKATVYLCPSCHKKAHDNESLLAFIRKIAQRKTMEYYNWDEWEFIKRIGRSFL